MKVARSIRVLHEDNRATFERLGAFVGEYLGKVCNDKGWFFSQRVKTLESFALKFETGRFSKERIFEDFYVCTIIVPTLLDIDQAEDVVDGKFEQVERRPRDDQHTAKNSSDFRFDSLRKYVRKKPADTGRGEDIDGLIFEVQIKSILEHAWSLATHDLIYKTNSVSWPKERIAYQVKATLEHADVSIAEAEKLSRSPSVAKRNKDTEEMLSIIELCEDIWPLESLPEDRRRLGENIRNLKRIASIGNDVLGEVVREEIRRSGILPKNLSPYSFVVQALLHSRRFNFIEMVRRSRRQVIIHSEMELPAELVAGSDGFVKID
ncbi:hypothetical protein CKO28_03950 [Rhodovibrio sodomensis]|uniref:RelA/SpoT domain-containing protein n=1 Tax=Rhodovibrio sodomensis TaxID=1088 RepID=A0ABS1DA02_9PROT|nr:hypothetical protein [Rhodovibrio sodomensis]MBK1667195.1 hypothetical protein [Rhodovibrio sodomensis]